MYNKIKPIGNRLVVKRLVSSATKGGILLPESAQEKPKQGTVIAIGEGKADDRGKIQPLNVKVGDEVLFSSYSGTEYTADDTEYLILSEDDVLGVLGG